jgi:hypothetical protein
MKNLQTLVCQPWTVLLDGATKAMLSLISSGRRNKALVFLAAQLNSLGVAISSQAGSVLSKPSSGLLSQSVTEDEGLRSGNSL